MSLMKKESIVCCPLSIVLVNSVVQQKQTLIPSLEGYNLKDFQLLIPSLEGCNFKHFQLMLFEGKSSVLHEEGT